MRETHSGGRVIRSIELSTAYYDEDEDWGAESNDHIAHIINRVGRTIFLSNNQSCNLDHVRLDGNFTPELGK